jgi:hypothetical protein
MGKEDHSQHKPQNRQRNIVRRRNQFLEHRLLQRPEGLFTRYNNNPKIGFRALGQRFNFYRNWSTTLNEVPSGFVALSRRSPAA